MHKCSLENKSTLHFFLHCHYNVPIRETWSGKLKTIDSNLLKVPNCKFTNHLIP